MKTLVDHLAQYAAYHRDRRNIFSHFIGIPMIVLSIAVLLARPALGFGLSPALLLALAAALFYLRLDLRFGVAMTALLALTVWGAAQLAAGTTAAWLGWGVGLFVVGWIIQFVGHYYEGRKPAFVDDLSGLIVGPLFVLAELAFLLGLRGDVQREVEERAGPTCIREHTRAAGGGLPRARETGVGALLAIRSDALADVIGAGLGARVRIEHAAVAAAQLGQLLEGGDQALGVHSALLQ